SRLCRYRLENLTTRFGLRLRPVTTNRTAGTDGAFEYEHLDIRGYEGVPALRRGLGRYFVLESRAAAPSVGLPDPRRGLRGAGAWGSQAVPACARWILWT